MFEKKMLTLDQLRLKRFTDFINKGKLGDIDPLEMGRNISVFWPFHGICLTEQWSFLKKFMKHILL